MEVVASLSQGRKAAAHCGLFTHKSVPVIFEPPCNSYKFTGCRTCRGVRGVEDKKGIFICTYRATENVTPLTPMEPEDHLNRIAENQ